MQLDYATTLFKKYAHITDPKLALRSVQVLDKTFLLGFNSVKREMLINLLPGLNRRLSGGLFGARSLQSAPLISAQQVIDRAHKHLGTQDNESAADMVVAYLAAHIALMSSAARLRLVSQCSDDYVRLYLRAVDLLPAAE